MRGTLFVTGIVLFLTLMCGTAIADPNMNPGQWQITTQTEMEGMSGMNIPPVTYSQCIRKEDMVPQNKDESQECQVTDIQEHGDTVSWKITCSGQNGKMQGTGTVTYKGDTMTGVMDMVIEEAGMRIKNKMSGKRIGDCQ